MREVTTHYCAGCGHGIVHKLIAQIMDELGIQEKTLVIAPVGCSVLAYNYLKADGLEAAHGRAPAVSTGLKRVQKDKVVICYQGDGDLLAIGTAETVHAANRGEHITVIFINNAIYGMTGGQMAPTTMEGQVTKTTPYGRDPKEVGWPIRACELLNTLEAPYYIERCAVYDVKHINQTKKAGGRIVAVGTTSTRTCESAAGDDGLVRAGHGSTGIFIYPGYKFKVIDSLITNFHLPKSTLMMLISALYDREKILEVYEEAIRERYRFFSYGDAMFIE